MGPGGPIRPGGPVPPRDPAYQPPPGQGQHQHQGGGAGRHAGGPGYAAPGGRRPGAQGQPGPAGPAEASDQFDGGYAYVIRPSDNPVRSASPTRPPSFGCRDPARPPVPARPADPARPSEPDVYVYRDTGSQPDDPAAAAPGPTSVTPPTGTTCPGPAPGEIPPRACPKRPAARSSPWCLPPTRPARRPASPPASTTPNPPRRRPLTPTRRRGRRQTTGQDTAHAHARKLEQIKDLYLTAEAIGEANVDKHFDQLLAQQRELIGEYFKQSSAARPAAGPRIRREPSRPAPQVRSRAIPGMPRPPAARRAHPRAPGVAADQPRIW